LFFSARKSSAVEDRPPRDREMTILEHLSELGTRLKRVAIAFVVAFIITWLPAPGPGGSPLNILTSFFVTGEYNPLAYWLFMSSLQPLMAELNKTGTVRIGLIAGEVWSPLNAVIYISLYFAALAVFPYLVYEVWMYVRPALYSHEEGAARRYLVPALLLFYAGNLFSALVVYPALLRFIVGMSRILNVEAIFSVSSVISSWIQLALITGAIFETPVVMAILSELCLLNPWSLAGYRPVVYALALIVIAILTPDTTLISTTLTFIPFALLFELGLLWSKRIVRKCPEMAREGLGVGR